MVTLKKPLKIKEKLVRIVELINERQAKDIVVLDVRNLSSLCDYFIICSGESTRQVRAIHAETVKHCRKDKIKVQHSEVDEGARWILVDFFDVILHIFFDEAREYYDLEKLWDKAKKVTVRMPRKTKNLP